MKAASLTASLLARKGEARPSMRRSALGIAPQPMPPSASNPGDSAPASKPEDAYTVHQPYETHEDTATIQSQIEAAGQAALSEGAALDAEIDKAVQRALDTEIQQPNRPAEPAPVPEGISPAEESPLWAKSNQQQAGRGQQVQHTAGEPRIHTSLRLEESLHMRLRIHAAKHHRSLQVVMLDALHRYLDAEDNDQS